MAEKEARELYQEMSTVDHEILALLEKRAKLSKAVAGRSAYVPAESASHLSDLRARAKGDLPERHLERIFGEIFASGQSMERPLRIAVGGPAQGPLYGATERAFGASRALVLAEDPITEVEHDRADLAVLPLESLERGIEPRTVHRMFTSELRILRVIDADEAIHLGAQRPLAELEILLAGPEERDRCLSWVRDRDLRLDVVLVASPKEAIRRALENPKSGAFAAPEELRRVGLAVIAENTVKGSLDRLRYVVLGARPAARTGFDASVIAFTLADSPGALFDALRPFSDKGINLLRIHSLPSLHIAGDYLFFVELEGHSTDRPVVSAIDEVRRTVKTFKILGSYALTRGRT